MTVIPKLDHKRASLTLYYVIALNTEVQKGRTINKLEAAHVLAKLLQIDRRAPMSWLRGDFVRHPLSRENFLKFVRAYRTKPGLENVREIAEFAIDLYGPEHKKAIEILDPEDRESESAQEVLVALPDESNLVTSICNLLESSSPDLVNVALETMIAYQWLAEKSSYKNLLM